MKFIVDFLELNGEFERGAEYILQLVIACVCGGMIGFERTKRMKEAGIRTHVIVCCAAAVMMIISRYGFADLAENGEYLFGTKGADPSRIAAQVVSGISFLGAGVIFKNGNTVKGLTTAAGIWLTAAVGLAIGARMYALGIIATFIILAVQYILHKSVFGAYDTSSYYLNLTVEDKGDFKEEFIHLMESLQIEVTDMKMDLNDNNKISYEISFKSQDNLSNGEMQKIFDLDGNVKSIECGAL